MRLRSLEVQGFKSFPDKTRLEFKDGITAVVGPNGSGKSNIGDAMRWVLGEQSTKTLRGGKMEDVIFGGTQARKAQGFAYVSLTIDNRDRDLHYDSDEVMISRKLYRSGESEYRLNSVNVRLKDIYELFMDTGLGRDGYSIIGQGKIAEIVSAKAQQRREIFEEAAGISKYRYRKAEAQRRLEGAEENLLRLRDILLELENRVEPLRIQAEKAEQFLSYASEKKTLEISLWVQTLDRSKAALREQEDKILLCKSEHDTLQSEIDDLEEDLNNIFAQMQALAVAVDSHRTRARELEECAARSASRVAVLENDQTHNTASAVRLEDELAQAGASGEELGQKIHTLEAELAQKELELEELRGQKTDLQQSAVETESRRAACAAQIEALKERRFGLNQSVNEAKLGAASSGSLIDETIARLATLKESAAVKDENTARIQKEISDCEELLAGIAENIGSLENAQKGFQMKLQGRQEKIAALEGQRRDWEDKARESRQKAKLLFDMENSMEGFAGSVKYIMGQVSRGVLQGVYGPVSRLLTVENRYALAIEIALGAALQNIAVQDEAVAKRAIGMLKEAKNGRATFLPLTTVKGNRLQEPWLAQTAGVVGLAAELVQADAQYAGMIDQLLGRIVIVEDIDCATAIAKRGGYRFRVVTLDGQVVNAGGSMTGGYAARSAGVLSRAGEIEALKGKAQEFEAKMAALDSDLKKLAAEAAATQASLMGIQGEWQTAQEDKIRYETERKQLGNACEEAVRTREQSLREYDQLTARLEELRAQNLTSGDLLVELDKQLAEVAVELTEKNAAREALEAEQRQLTESLSEQNLLVVSQSKDIEAVRQMALQLGLQKDNQQEHRALIERQRAALQAQSQEIQAEIEQETRQKEEYAAAAREENAQITAKTEARNGKEAKANELRGDEKEILARRENVGRELGRLEEKKNAMQAEYDSIIARLWDEYEMTRSQAAELAQPVAEDGSAQRRLAELKGKIKALGNVNVAAVEEYQEVSERYRFLKAQTDDAQQSKDELLRLIGQLTEDMQQIFADNFQKIAVHFSHIFSELFGGGRGTLSLTDPNNMLESGIEINVQPPGKLIEHLAALSGGEQALVAIAVYFAILKVRPSPFVLLDEIEAALDDVNVVKYAQYLRTICGKIQFITITHRRGTMEEADILYGVTMQEEGVSKLLQLNVGEIESRLGIK